MKILQVREYVELINETLALLPKTDLVIEGEISDYRVSQGKWVSFDLKDEEEDVTLKCFTTVWKVQVPVEDGMRVRVTGYSRVYERFGTLKLNVESIAPVGEGSLRQAYEKLKKQLEAEGLFDPSRRRALPRFPGRVGVITSREAAAYTDFLRIANDRFGGAQIQLYAVHVQGRHAVADILEAFAYFNALEEDDRPDVLVLTRGGGSLEDLHAFNDASVARAVFGSKIPVVVGVGHERDESLADFVADVRASTPSNAAERVFPSRTEVLQEIQTQTDRWEMVLRHRLDTRRGLIQQSGHSMSIFFERLLHQWETLVERCVQGFARQRERTESRLVQMEQLLNQVDPARVLLRGYSLVRSQNGLITDASTLEVGEGVQVQLARGTFGASVTDVSKS